MIFKSFKFIFVLFLIISCYCCFIESLPKGKCPCGKYKDYKPKTKGTEIRIIQHFEEEEECDCCEPATCGKVPVSPDAGCCCPNEASKPAHACPVVPETEDSLCECAETYENVIANLFTRVCTNFCDKLSRAGQCTENHKYTCSKVQDPCIKCPVRSSGKMTRKSMKKELEKKFEEKRSAANGKYVGNNKVKVK